MDSNEKQICEYVVDKSGIIRIYVEPFAYNIASCRVLEKAGFQYERTLRSNAVKNGKVIDMKRYSLLKAEERLYFCCIVVEQWFFPIDCIYMVLAPCNKELRRKMVLYYALADLGSLYCKDFQSKMGIYAELA